MQLPSTRTAVTGRGPGSLRTQLYYIDKAPFPNQYFLRLGMDVDWVGGGVNIQSNREDQQPMVGVGSGGRELP